MPTLRHTADACPIRHDIAVVITTLNPDANPVAAWAKATEHVWLIGDRKSTEPAALPERASWVPFSLQNEIDVPLAAALPTNHYARKNLGYLRAIASGATIIYDTDDDNAPLAEWAPPAWETDTEFTADGPLVNVYAAWTDDRVWPRGFPLDRLAEARSAAVRPGTPRRIGVWQGLANLDPDVDAIHRLVFGGPVRFRHATPAALPPHTWSPFNSQATAWKPETIDLAYLPGTVSMRWTDILRGYVAQRLLWERGLCLGFYGPAVEQHRNEHNLIADLAAEQEMYAATGETIATLERLDLAGIEPSAHLRRAYEALAAAGIVQPSELDIIDAWYDALAAANAARQGETWTRRAS